MRLRLRANGARDNANVTCRSHYQKSLLRDNDRAVFRAKLVIIYVDWIALLRRLLKSERRCSWFLPKQIILDLVLSCTPLLYCYWRAWSIYACQEFTWQNLNLSDLGFLHNPWLSWQRGNYWLGAIRKLPIRRDKEVWVTNGCRFDSLPVSGSVLLLNLWQVIVSINGQPPILVF